MILWPDCAKKSPKKARPQTNLGVALYQRGKISEAMNRYSEALRIDPNYKNTHYNLANTFEKQGKFEEARINYEAALRTRPDFPESSRNLQRTLQLIGRPIDVTKTFVRP